MRGPISAAVSTGVADTGAVSAGVADTAAVSAGAADTAAVSAGAAASAADSAAVETVMAPPIPGMQKPPRWVGKRFRDHFAAASLKVWRPRAVQTTPT
jgi:hypothetical protein